MVLQSMHQKRPGHGSTAQPSSPETGNEVDLELDSPSKKDMTLKIKRIPSSESIEISESKQSSAMRSHCK